MIMDNIDRSNKIPSICDMAAALSSYSSVEDSDKKGKDVDFQYKDMQKKKSFPKQLKLFLNLIPGNDVCPDCQLNAPFQLKRGLPSNHSSLPWANVEYGTLICEECAGQHIKMNSKTSSILSLDHSKWTLPQIVSILEGGNAKFLHAFHYDLHDRRHKSWRRLSSRNLVEEKTENIDCHTFEYRYKHDTKLESYKTSHALQTTKACRSYGGYHMQSCNTSIIPEQDVNNGASLATYFVTKSQRGQFSVDLATKFLSIRQNNHEDIIGPKECSKPERRRSSKDSMKVKACNDGLKQTSPSRTVSAFFHRLDSGMYDDQPPMDNQVKPQPTGSSQLRLSQSLHQHKSAEGKQSGTEKYHTSLNNHGPKQTRSHSFHVPSRNVVTEKVKLHRHSFQISKTQKDQATSTVIAWDYRGSSGKSKPMRQPRNNSIDTMTSMINPLLYGTGAVKGSTNGMIDGHFVPAA